MIREYFLQQDAFHDVDTFCPLDKQHLMVQTILDFADQAYQSVELGKKIQDVLALPSRAMIARMKFEKEHAEYAKEVSVQMRKDFSSMFGGDEQ